MGLQDGCVEQVLRAYGDLMMRTVSNLIYLDPPMLARKSAPLHMLYKRIGVETESPENLARRRTRRLEGLDWPAVAHSMTGYKRLQNLTDCVIDVLLNEIEGDLIETGVWRGGSCILMQGLIKAAGDTRRRVFVADSFEGLPPPDVENYPEDRGDKLYKRTAQLGVSLESVKENFSAYGLLDPNVIFLKGWFKDTLPVLDADKFAIVRLDGDMYESTIQALDALYPKLSIGGYLIVDDFGAVEGCRKAITDYRNNNKIDDEIIKIDSTGVFWQKSR